LQELFGRERFAGDVLAEGYAREQLHGDKRAALVFAYVVNGANIRVVQAGGRTRFPKETLDRRGITGGRFAKKLQSDGAAKARVLGLVNHAHAAAAKGLPNAIVRDRLVGHWIGMLGVQLPTSQ
jgi:hypothetical protein